MTGPIVVERSNHPGYSVETWRIDGADGGPLTATAYLPAGEGRWPAVLAGHGLGGDRTAAYVTGAGKAWAEQGLAVVAVDFPFHGERGPASPGLPGILGVGSYAATAVADLRALTGAASSHPAIDPGRLGYLGFSMGAVLGVRFVAEEPLMRSAVFVVGGAPAVALGRALPALAGIAGPLLAALDPVPYATAVSPRPVLMLNAESDEIFSVESARALFDAFGEPKRLELFPGTHAEWRGTAERHRSMRDFFAATL